MRDAGGDVIGSQRDFEETLIGWGSTAEVL